MRVCVIHTAQDLRLEDRARPSVTPQGVLVRVRAGGICGSDLHYFFEGRNGDFQIREPFIPGHEFAGEIAEVGAEVTRLRPGQRVAVHPGRNCGRCFACREGRGNLCRNVFFMGSASRFPHMQGGFADYVLVDESQVYPVSPDLSFGTAAFAEPLAVALHAVERAGPVLGRSVLITGAGPIGLLVLLAVKRAGAETVCVTDILDQPLALARQLGGDHTVNVAASPQSLDEVGQQLNGFEAAFEVSGNPAGLATCLEAVRPGATVVQVGTLPAGRFPVAGNLVMAKEIDLRGAMRFDREFAHSVACLDRRLIDVEPLLTASVPAEQASAAFAMAKQRDKHSKVQITF
ncbi:MAG: L-idonate 5-dehydrogenase [Acidisphaera sp.]|nr:L-idonate 5-dehydrogenase [Acidisphaera sp.]